MRRCQSTVRFEDVETSKLLIQDRERLELLCLFDLLLEPILDFILLHFFEVLVVVVEMSMLVRCRSEARMGRIGYPHLFS